MVGGVAGRLEVNPEVGFAMSKPDADLIKEELAEWNPDALAVDGLDGAIVGYGQQFPDAPVLVYNYDKCVQVFMGQGMSWEEAVEWMEYNVVNAYHGKGTPIFMRKAE